MKRYWTMAAVLAALIAFPSAGISQTFSARRMAMGGVEMPGGAGADAANVAYRAVPSAQGGVGGVGGISLPLGLLQLISNPPQFDSSKPDFNIYQLANLLYNPPWNLELSKPAAPASDITIAVAKNSLAVDLGEIANVFPKDHSRIGLVNNGPSLGFGVGNMFVAAAPLIHYENDLSLNAALSGALARGEPFTPNTEYAMFDKAKGQVAAGVQFGWVGAVARQGDNPRAKGGSALYLGVRVKAMRGLAYGDADNTVAFTTNDTLFGSNPVNIHYSGLLRDAGPSGGGFGTGFDLGAAWLKGPVQFGLGVNDVATRIRWKVRESLARTDSVTGQYVQQVLRENARFTSDVPPTITANVAWMAGPIEIAADLVRSAHATGAHLGCERWIGNIALRAGSSLDANSILQFGGGTGIRFGRFGLDAAVATNSRNLSRQRGVELGLGLGLYH